MIETKVKIGVIGCGVISGNYFEGCKTFDILDVVACADLEAERARAKAERYGIPRACSVEELLADPDIEIVVNLTTPAVHYEIALAAIKAGKSVYNEKPLAVSRGEASEILDTAAARGVLVGCAPDIFLGGVLQTCRKLIDEGQIGRPIAAAAFMMSHGPEGWHPEPDFYYQPGGGPMFDMGPYYLTALISMLGPVSRVTGSTRTTYAERTIGSQLHRGKKIKVATPTYVTGVLDFAGGAIATMITTFDVGASELPAIEIYGTEGTVSTTNPSYFRGSLRMWRSGERSWSTVPLSYGYSDIGRGIGVADMAYALRSGRPHRASGELGYHVLDIMHAFDDSARAGNHVVLTSTCERPAPLPPDLPYGTLDE
jgi:predicted dehydrogenase